MDLVPLESSGRWLSPGSSVLWGPRLGPDMQPVAGAGEDQLRGRVFPEKSLAGRAYLRHETTLV